MSRNINLSHTYGKENPFQDFKFSELFTGTPLYKYEVFHKIKNLVTQYDDRLDYMNHGCWSEGDETKNPSASLVDRVIAQLDVHSNDTLLDIGSGIGQPDVDIANHFPMMKIIGINNSEEQVIYANKKFKALGLENRIHHRITEAARLGDSLENRGITCAFSIEGLSEILESDETLRGLSRILPPGGRVCFCNVVRQKNPNGGFLKKTLSSLLMGITRLTYGDRWRTEEEYKEILNKNGFQKIEQENIGVKVFPFLYRFAKKRFPLLKENRIPFFPRLLTFLNVKGLDLLFSWGQIEYTLFSGEKPGR